MDRVLIEACETKFKSALRNPKFAILSSALLLVLGSSSSAQQPKKIPRIGWLTAAPLSATAPRAEAFGQGLRELGYVEGKNIVIEWRSPEGKPDRPPTWGRRFALSGKSS